MRKDAALRHARLVTLIEAVISSKAGSETRELLGFTWAVLPQSEWSARLKITPRTLRNLAKIAPIVAQRTVTPDRRPITLYRTGAPPLCSAKKTANMMAKAFRQKYKIDRVSRADWGCLNGLAEIWPQGSQVAIFKAVLNDLPLFMAAVRTADPDSQFRERYYEFLPIKLLRKFHDIGLNIYLMELQQEGGALPSSFPAKVKALFPVPLQSLPITPSFAPLSEEAETWGIL
jgi:hypothetical protein